MAAQTHKTDILNKFISDDYYTTIVTDELEQVDPQPKERFNPLTNRSYPITTPIKRYFGNVILRLGINISKTNTKAMARLVDKLQHLFPNLEYSCIVDHVQVLYGNTTDSFFRVANYWNFRKLQEKMNIFIRIGQQTEHHWSDIQPKKGKIFFGIGRFRLNENDNVQLKYSITINEQGCDVYDADEKTSNTISRNAIKHLQRFIAKFRREWLPRQKTIISIQLFEKKEIGMSRRLFKVEYQDGYVVTNIRAFPNSNVRYSTLLYYFFDTDVNILLFNTMLVTMLSSYGFTPHHSSRHLVLSNNRYSIVCEQTKKNAVQITMYADTMSEIDNYLDIVCKVRNKYVQLDQREEFVQLKDLSIKLSPTLPQPHNFNYRELKILTYKLVYNTALDTEIFSQQKFMFLPNLFPSEDNNFYSFLQKHTMKTMKRFAERISLEHGLVCTYSRQPYLQPIEGTNWFRCIAPIHESSMPSVYNFFKQTIHSKKETAYTIPSYVEKYLPVLKGRYKYFVSTDVPSDDAVWREMISQYITYPNLAFVIFTWDVTSNVVKLDYQAMGKFNSRAELQPIYTHVCCLVVIKNSYNGEHLRVLAHIDESQANCMLSTPTLNQEDRMAARHQNESWIISTRELPEITFDVIRACVRHRNDLIKSAIDRSNVSIQKQELVPIQLQYVYAFGTATGTDSAFFGNAIAFGINLSQATTEPMSSTSGRITARGINNDGTSELLENDDETSLVATDNVQSIAKIDTSLHNYVLILENDQDRLLYRYLRRIYSNVIDILYIYIRARVLITRRIADILGNILKTKHKLVRPIGITSLIDNNAALNLGLVVPIEKTVEKIVWINDLRTLANLASLANIILDNSHNFEKKEKLCLRYSNEMIEAGRREIVHSLLPKYNLTVDPSFVSDNIIRLYRAETRNYSFITVQMIANAVFQHDAKRYMKHHKLAERTNVPDVIDDSIEIRRLLRNILYVILSEDGQYLIYDGERFVEVDPNVLESDGLRTGEKRKFQKKREEEVMDDEYEDEDEKEIYVDTFPVGTKNNFENMFTMIKSELDKEDGIWKGSKWQSNLPLLC